MNLTKPRKLLFSLSYLLASSSLLTAEKLPLLMVTNSGAEIDYLIETANKKKNIQPNPLIDDATFLRRTYLTIIGRIPTLDEAKTFLDSKAKDKRSKLIDQLVYSPGFDSHQTNFYANLLRLRSDQEQFGLGWSLWLRDAVKQNKGYDKIVYEMLSSSGHCSTDPEVGYYLRDRGMLLDNISNTAKIFLGTQIGCAQCHDHPFEDWTQKQYYQLAAFGSQIEFRSQDAREQIRATIEFKRKNNSSARKPSSKLSKKERQARKRINKAEARDLNSLFKNFNKNTITLSPSRELKLPDDYMYNDAKPGEVISPHVLFGQIPKSAGDTSLEQLASWVTNRSNPMFTKVFANRLWKQAMGYALVEPVDNWTDRSKVAHPEVLDTLVQILHATDFDSRETLRVIYHSKLFQREVCDFEITDGRVHDFRGPLLRRMSAEQIYDSLLTLQKGNIDSSKNSEQKEKWQVYTEEIYKLLHATPAQIIALDNQADFVEDATRDLTTKNRLLRAKRDDASNDGNKALAKRISREMSKNYQKIKKLRSKAMAKQQMSISMVSMTNRLTVRNRDPLRASEMTTPFKAGSFARDFGASDRITTDAQHTLASIPQALVMLNGKQIESITSHKGILATKMKSTQSEEDRFDLLFLSLYSSYPTKEEYWKYRHAIRSRQDIKILAKAMLNSKRFLFIQ